MRVYLSVLLALFIGTSFAQKYKSEESIITFFSEAAIEDIAATNEEATSLFNLSTGEVAYLVPISGFVFEKSLMQQHFNEKYLESDKFPVASFKGIISGFDPTYALNQDVTAVGTMTIHGEKNIISTTGTIKIQDGTIVMKSTFNIELKDYKIKIPKLLWSNIAEEVEVKIEFTYKPL